MKSITIKIETVNAAFDDNKEAVIADILNDIVLSLKDGGYLPSSLYDYNGNKVGTITTR